jgi:hypothetical protein
VTMLVLALAIDCYTTVAVTGWKVGPFATYERTMVEKRQPNGGTAPEPAGCRIGWANNFEPDVISWCDHLGPDRCTLAITP